METIAISEFKATCLKLLEKVRQTGEGLIVTKKGEPIVVIAPAPTPRGKRRFGAMKATGRVCGDLQAPLEIEWEVLKS